MKFFKTLGLTAAIVIASQTGLLFQQNKVLAEAGSDKLFANEILRVDQYLLSSDGSHKLILQSDGNLVLYNSFGVGTWSSNTTGRIVNYAIMQSDGNFVLYGPLGAVWDSKTAGSYGAYLTVQNDGNTVIYKPAAVWYTNTTGR